MMMIARSGEIQTVILRTTTTIIGRRKRRVRKLKWREDDVKRRIISRIDFDADGDE
jgi:hypothetical protein